MHPQGGDARSSFSWKCYTAAFVGLFVLDININPLTQHWCQEYQCTIESSHFLLNTSG